MEYRIKEIAQTKGVSLKQLAELCGLSTPSLYNIANGKLAPKVSTLENIATNLGVPITDLFKLPKDTNPYSHKDGRFIVTCPCCGQMIGVNIDFSTFYNCQSPRKGDIIATSEQ
jgi:transcriptional regulator with XRE-family HTH domain